MITLTLLQRKLIPKNIPLKERYFLVLINTKIVLTNAGKCGIILLILNSHKHKTIRGEPKVFSAEVELKNETGLHARPASQFVFTSSKFKSHIVIIKDGKEYNAKSIMGVLSMGASKGTILTIKAEGEDEQEAVEALKALIEGNFGE